MAASPDLGALMAEAGRFSRNVDGNSTGTADANNKRRYNFRRKTTNQQASSADRGSVHPRATPSVVEEASPAILIHQMNQDRGEREKRLEEELRIQRESLKSIAQAMEENRPRNTRPSSPETLFNSGDDDDHGSVAGNTVINNAESLRRTHDRLLKSLKRSGEYTNFDSKRHFSFVTYLSSTGNLML